MSAEVQVGDLVDDKYRILRLIGEGGWGIVFEAENVRTLKRVALKVLRAHDGVTPEIQARFEREAQAAGRIGSEHIVEVFDLGSLADGTRYMVMELLTGEDLASRLQREKRIEPIVAAELVVQLLDGLEAAHGAGILHRDLKPENLFLVPTRGGDEFLKILDFGISKFSDGKSMSATMTGAVLGSPCYMAPEQARGLRQIDARTDLYAVGTLLFELVTGSVPFVGDNFNDLMFKIVLAPRPDPRTLVPDLDTDLAAIILKAISAEPSARYANAVEFRDAITAWLEAHGVQSVRRPELRPTRRTPRTTNDPRPSRNRSDGAGREPHWSDATVQVNSAPGDTPIASSRTASITEPSARKSKRSYAYAGAAAAFLLLIGVVALKARGSAKPDPASAAAPTGAPVATAPATTAAPGASAATIATVEPMPEASATASATASADTAPTAPTAPATGTAHKPGKWPAGSPAASSTATAVAGNATATAPPPTPTPDPPKPAATSTGKAGDTVEGRGIRTNL